ncbi:hypothetical protein NEDG_01684 [Nematocida displodere]|uniref:Uncharacterized protein n=1 Tax=Nematocida displodere TaxID=1805483 RepID=A0A177EF39_9MICR|nr:hypothetical protein NEDG_01684 [Nematocida displodere]
MKFTVEKDSLKSLELLEFRGEFLLPEELPMTMEGSTIFFASSAIKGTSSPLANHLVLRRTGGGVEVFGETTAKTAFISAPKYFVKRKSRPTDPSAPKVSAFKNGA